MANDKPQNKTGMGLVTKVSEIRETEKHRKYFWVTIGEVEYSCWKTGLLDQFKLGSSVQFHFTEKDDYKNIVSVESDGNGSRAGGSGQPTKDELIVRQTCIKTAGGMVNIVENEPTVKAADTITIAELLETWVWREKSNEPPPPEDE